MRRQVLYALVLLGIYLSYRVLSPFFAALTWAVLFAILFRGMQAALARRTGPNGAAVITTLVVGIVIVAPAIVLISALVREAPQAIVSLKQASENAPAQIERIWDAIRERSPIAVPEDPTDLMTTGAQRAVAYLAPQAGSFLADFFATLGSLVAMLFALFFFLRDGDAISRQLRDRLPFGEQENQSLISETRDLVLASVGAGLAVAAAQGVIGGAAFWLLGIGAPVVWGVVIAFCSLLPVVGAAIVWVPAGIWLVLSGAIGRGVAMLLIGAFGISMADNILRPLLLSGRTSVSGLVIFFGLLGGVAAFGFIGIVVGPIILVITARLLEELRRSDVGAPSTPPDVVRAPAPPS
ncbi:MAG TPA: AI-2E family transporter [Casimicrobiaceae bacterium]|nr:AI-2E family transporter [Casimicrobiaceae bacterium]